MESLALCRGGDVPGELLSWLSGFKVKITALGGWLFGLVGLGLSCSR